MPVLERVATLIRANLNDLIDRAEDPEKMIKQVIVDMENQLLQVKTQVAIAIADQHLLEKKQKENDDKVTEWMRKAELAVGIRSGRARLCPPINAFLHLPRVELDDDARGGFGLGKNDAAFDDCFGQETNRDLRTRSWIGPTSAVGIIQKARFACRQHGRA